MNEFTIKGDGNYFKLTLKEVFDFPKNTCAWGGYEAQSHIEVNSDGFTIKAINYTSTGELYDFYNQLIKCNESLKGEAKYMTYEGNLELTATYDSLGHVKIIGKFSKQNLWSNHLNFEFDTDQTYIRSTLTELEQIVNKYGGMKGIK